MKPMSLEDIQFFDPNAETDVVWKKLPHWAQAGTLCFITWRTADSMPREAIQRLADKRAKILKEFHLDSSKKLSESLLRLNSVQRAKVHWALFKDWDSCLDDAMGACQLLKPDLSKIVMDSLLHFQGDRYFLTDAVIMPNHVHLIAAFRNSESLLSQCTSWKHYTATQINRWLYATENFANKLKQKDVRADPAAGSQSQRRPKSEFWQTEQFDHLIRSEEEFHQYRLYVAENPVRAKLSSANYRHFSADLTRVAERSP